MRNPHTQTPDDVHVSINQDSISALADAIVRQIVEIPDNDKLLLLSDVAEILRLSPRKVEELVSDGSLTPIRFGRARRFSRDQVLAFVRSAAGRRTTR